MANNVQNVGFGSPGSDYSADVSEIERRRALAAALQNESMQPVQNMGQPGSRLSPFQGLAKIFQGYQAGAAGKEATQMQRDLAQKSQSDYSNVVASALRQMRGTPAGEMPGSELSPGFQTPEVRPDMTAAMMTLMQHPQGAALAPILREQAWLQRVGGGAPQQQQQNPMVPNQPGSSVMAGSGQSVPQAQPVPQSGSGVNLKDPSLYLGAPPGGEKWLEYMAKQAEGKNLRAGSTLLDENNRPIFTAPMGGMQTTWGANGPTSAPIQGAQEGEARGAGLKTGAEQAARFPYSEQTTAGGARVPAFTIPSLMQQAPGGAVPWGPTSAPVPQQQPVPGPRPAPRPAPQPTPQPQAAPGQDPWATMPRIQQPQGLGQSTYQHSQATQAGEAGVKLQERFGELAQHANDRKAINTQAMSLVDSADTGPMAGQIAGVKNWLTSRLGIPEDHFANTPSATIALQKDLLNAATQKAKQQFGARMTQSEVMLMLSKGAPNIDMTKAAMKYLITSDIAQSDYQIKQANDLGRYMQQGGDPLRFEAWYSQAFPLAQHLGGVHMGGNLVKDITNSGSQASPDDLVKKWLR